MLQICGSPIQSSPKLSLAWKICVDFLFPFELNCCRRRLHWSEWISARFKCCCDQAFCQASSSHPEYFAAAAFLSHSRVHLSRGESPCCMRKSSTIKGKVSCFRQCQLADHSDICPLLHFDQNIPFSSQLEHGAGCHLHCAFHSL